MRCKCGGFLNGAKLDLIEDNNFYLLMTCQECEEEYLIETKPTVMKAEDGEEIELGFYQEN